MSLARRYVMVATGENFPDTDESSANAKYKVTYASGKVEYDMTDVGAQHGTVKITDTWMNMDCAAHKYTFMQTATPNGGFASDGGLRMQIELMITNESGKAWSSYWVKTDDMVPMNTTPVSASHRHEAHFHPNGATSTTGPPTVSGMTGFMTFSDFNNEQMIEIGGGQHQSGKTFNTKGFFLHERNLQKTTDGVTQNLTRHVRFDPHATLCSRAIFLVVDDAGLGRRSDGASLVPHRERRRSVTNEVSSGPNDKPG